MNHKSIHYHVVEGGRSKGALRTSGSLGEYQGRLGSAGGY